MRSRLVFFRDGSVSGNLFPAVHMGETRGGRRRIFNPAWNSLPLFQFYMEFRFRRRSVFSVYVFDAFFVVFSVPRQEFFGLYKRNADGSGETTKIRGFRVRDVLPGFFFYIRPGTFLVLPVPVRESLISASAARASGLCPEIPVFGLSALAFSPEIVFSVLTRSFSGLSGRFSPSCLTNSLKSSRVRNICNGYTGGRRGFRSGLGGADVLPGRRFSRLPRLRDSGFPFFSGIRNRDARRNLIVWKVLYVDIPHCRLRARSGPSKSFPDFPPPPPSCGFSAGTGLTGNSPV